MGLGRVAPHRRRHGSGGGQDRPWGTVGEAKALLESDPARAIEGEEHLRAWLQDLMDTTIADLDGEHFDIPEPLKRVEAMIAPPASAAAMYYTMPSEDMSRPGRTWYPTLAKSRFPLWGEVSIAYHEGVPGHHLQLGQVRFLADKLSRFQRITGPAPTSLSPIAGLRGLRSGRRATGAAARPAFPRRLCRRRCR